MVPDDSEDFDDVPDDDDDSFDEDFDADDAEDELPGEDDEFDMEAYLKWRAENPDAGDAPASGNVANDPGAELPEDDEEADDYDDEDDWLSDAAASLSVG